MNSMMILETINSDSAGVCVLNNGLGLMPQSVVDVQCMPRRAFKNSAANECDVFLETARLYSNSCAKNAYYYEIR